MMVLGCVPVRSDLGTFGAALFREEAEAAAVRGSGLVSAVTAAALPRAGMSSAGRWVPAAGGGMRWFPAERPDPERVKVIIRFVDYRCC